MQLPSEEWAVVATIDPDDYTTGTYYSDVIDMGDFEEILVIVAAGTIDASGTWDVKIQESVADSPFSAQDITGKSITQLTQAGSDADKQALINLKSDELDVADYYKYVRVAATAAAGGGDLAVVVIGRHRYMPSSDYDLASVDEIVN